VRRFVYVLDGVIEIVSGEGEKRHALTSNGYAYLPQGSNFAITASESSRVAVIEKRYQTVAEGSESQAIFSHENKVNGVALGGDTDLMVRGLLPDTMSFDFAVNTMTYQPGAALSMVEMHVMEHGLLMLEGGGIYRLDDQWYSVTAGDFIWMGPYCPQWFGAIGKAPAKYLIYKDWNRHPLG
jgi:(S)-ureidoglycine aminohydrolase